MAMVKVPAENQPRFLAALPSDPRLEVIRMFGGMVAKVNGNVFAGLFGRSAMVLLQEPERSAALELEGAGFFDPMGDGRASSKKVMLPETVMHDAAALQRWIRRAFDAATQMPPKPAVAKRAGTDPEAGKKKTVAKKTVAKKTVAKKTATKKTATKKTATKKTAAK